MTPFAMMLAKQFLRERRQNGKWFTGSLTRLTHVVSRFPDTQCFLLNSAAGLLNEFTEKHFPHHVDERLMFWPGPCCWFEVGHTNATRAAFLVEGNDDPHAPAIVRLLMSKWISASDEELSICDEITIRPSRIIAPESGNEFNHCRMLASILTAINQPKVIGRTIAHAHRGMEAKLRQAFPGQRFKLPDVITLNLEAFVTREVDEDHGSESRGPGSRRRYHFVRAHVREANGQFVRPHWRGDASLGVSRKNYNLVPPRR